MMHRQEMRGHCTMRQPPKITILADSLALPRGEVPYDGIYPTLLDNRFRCRYGAHAPRVINRGMRYRTIREVQDEWTEQVELVAADIVVVHVGLVDCAPRVFLHHEHLYIERMRSARLRNVILGFVNNHRRALIRWRPHRVYVPLPHFVQGVAAIIQRVEHSTVHALILLNIILPTDELEYRSPGFQRNVDLYNDVLASHAGRGKVSLVDVNALIWRHGGPDRLTVDGTHINCEGHRLVADALEEHLAALPGFRCMVAPPSAPDIAQEKDGHRPVVIR